MDTKIDRLDAKMDRQFEKMDTKMDRQFSTIMAFVALGRLPGGFSEKTDVQSADDGVDKK